MNCPSCGSSIDGDTRFCPSCGAAISADAAAQEPARSFEIPKYPGSSERGDEPNPTYAPPPGSSYQSQWTTAQPGSDRVAPFGAVYAGWWQRVGSLLIDTVGLWIIYRIVSAIVNHHNHSGTSAVLVVLFVVAQGFYFTRLNGLNAGQTVGNKALSICVRDFDTGQPIGVKRGFVRWGTRTVLYLLIVIPGLINDLYPLWDKNHQSLADKVAHSVVVKL